MHDTTDQWREIRLVASPIFEKRPVVPGPSASRVPRGVNHVVVHEMTVITMVSVSSWKAHGMSMLVSRYKNKGFVKS